ncbi:glycoside hydrolase family 16 protein [Jaapia argillacea MUCL 33604]|uniref:Glycoside hydrolase family 16 protein n=1 Tax=Jaapia argillacea MUCL 33604 TaxID=933084 RepID=A0A067PC21_9AGAM|nr:glycoside hydrolase family 16 protein [Jaapia argillacea MUCL 33604]
MSSPWPQQGADGETQRSMTPPSDESQNSSSNSYHNPPLSPNSPPSEAPLLSDASRAPTRSTIASGFVSSPLNPHNGLSPSGSPPFARSRPVSRAGSMRFSRIASEDSQVLGASLHSGNRASMLLYRLAGDDHGELVPPRFSAQQRDSLVSSSGDSIFSLSADSKYPSGTVTYPRGLVPYAYDPALDEKDGPEDDDPLHDNDVEMQNEKMGMVCWSWRGFMNVGLLVILVAALLCLFVFYPVLEFFRTNSRNLAISENLQVNTTGQALYARGQEVLVQIPDLVDRDTPASVQSRTGFDGFEYELVFSDEFNVDGRQFYPGDDPFWEAVNLRDGSTSDEAWYDPGQITTANGSLRITMDNIPTNGLPFKSGMLQSWNKFCFTGGYIEVSLSLPGSNSNTAGYRPRASTLGNLARAGYGATTDGTWPYSYDTCDLGTLPKQTLKDGSGPAAALHSDASGATTGNSLSSQPGQKLSACTCSGEDHPGPTTSKGRGAPQIDILEVETVGNRPVVSQSTHLAPYTHDYLYNNATTDQFQIIDPSITTPNTYHGSVAEQAISALTVLPDDMFQGSGDSFKTLGVEYFADPSKRDEGFITWQSNGKATVRVGAGAVGPDQGPEGSMVGQRLIPEEPMSIILNLGISSNIDLNTILSPAVMLVDYVRVYQRKGAMNVGCSPSNYPTADYINRHMDAYTNPNLTSWRSNAAGTGAGYTWPKNSLCDGC